MVLRRRYCLPRARVPPLKAEDEEEKVSRFAKILATKK